MSADIDRPGPLAAADAGASDLLAHAAALAVRHRETIRTRAIAPGEDTMARVRSILGEYSLEEGRAPAAVLDDVADLLADGTVHTVDPRYFGLFNPASAWPGVAGDVLTAASNPQLAAYSHAPAAVELDRRVLRLVAARLGMPDGTAGTFTSGGAEANHTATLVALTARVPGFAEEGLAGTSARPVLYASAESHLAWLKIAHACGMGRQAVRFVPVDHRHRLDLSALERMHRADVAAGMRPVMVAATAGTTGAGAIDPLPEIARFCREHGLHFHVDAAWAGAVVLSDALGSLLAGAEHADTVTIDAHKWMSAPMGAGMLLAADPQSLREAFRVATSYMPGATDAVDDPYTVGMQWSRRAIGLKVFVLLASTGRRGMAEQIERDVALGGYIARAAHERGWLVVNDTPLPVVCIADASADALTPAESDERHGALADAVVSSGAAWISPVRLAGRAALRICVTNYASTRADADRLLDALDAARAG